MKKILLALISFCVYSGENSLYDFSWLDQDKEVYVLQNRKFRKDGRFRIGGSLGKSLNRAFVDSTGFNLYAAYFFKEDWGIEVSLSQYSGDTNKTHEGVNEQGAVAFYRKIDSATNIMVIWSPFYGKINTFNQIYYFDWFFGLGFANMTTSDNRNDFVSSIQDGTLVEESVSGITWMTGTHFHLSKSFSLRLDFKAYHVNADGAVDDGASSFDLKKKYFHYYNLGLGLNYTF